MGQAGASGYPGSGEQEQGEPCDDLRAHFASLSLGPVGRSVSTLRHVRYNAQRKTLFPLAGWALAVWESHPLMDQASPGRTPVKLERLAICLRERQ